MRAELGVIVAGGPGARLGLGAPKRSLAIGGASLLSRAIATLGPVCEQVVVATPRERRPADDELSGARWVEDAPAESRQGTPVNATNGPARSGGAGPLAGIVAGFGAFPFRRAIVLGVDFPFVRAGFLEGLLAELDRSGAAIVAPAPGGMLQPLLAAYSGATVAPIAAAFASGERSPSRVIAALGARALDEAFLAGLDGGLDNLIDVDTPADLEAARHRLARLGSRLEKGSPS